jgi:hypothetical protein
MYSSFFQAQYLIFNKAVRNLRFEISLLNHLRLRYAVIKLMSIIIFCLIGKMRVLLCPPYKYQIYRNTTFLHYILCILLLHFIF